MTSPDWPDKLEKIAAAIYKTCYDHELAMKKHDRARKITFDDGDYLRLLAKELRGPEGQLAHELKRQGLPWEGS